MFHSNPSTKSFDLTDSAKSIISKARTTNILFSFKLSESSYKLIKKRISVLQEVQETEQNYLHDIHILIEFWEPAIRHLRLFNESELTQIFKDFPCSTSTRDQTHIRLQRTKRASWSSFPHSSF